MFSLGYKRRYLSEGLFPNFKQKYGQVLSILSVLLSVSNLIFLVIVGADIGKYSREAVDASLTADTQTSDGGRTADTQTTEGGLIYAVQVVTAIYTILQLVCLCILMLYMFCPSFTRNNTYVLTLAVTESEGKVVTMYGSTASTQDKVNSSDVCVFYHRVTGSNCHSFCEPMSLPLHAISMPSQVLCLLLSLILLILESALLDMNTFYTAVTVVSVMNTIQQTALTLITYVLATDTGFCCFGLSVTRWFIHTDMYTQTLEKLVKQSFEKPEQNGSEEWYKSTLSTLAQQRNMTEGGDLTSNRAGQVKLLQHFLEDWHEQLYREVYVGQDAVSLFITKNEKDRLNEFYTRRILSYDSDEKIVFQRK